MIEAFVEPSGAMHPSPKPKPNPNPNPNPSPNPNPNPNPNTNPKPDSSPDSSPDLDLTLTLPYSPVGIVHLVMELCSGPTLQWVLDGRGALSEVEASSRAILLRPYSP